MYPFLENSTTGIAINEGEKPYKCHYCEESFKLKRTRTKHLRMFHEEYENLEKDDHFSDNLVSNNDIMIKKEPKIEDLPLSNFEFEGTTTDTIKNLTASEIINLKIKPFKCEDCDYSSSRKGQLISKGNFGVFKSTKKPTFFLRIFALASKVTE